MTVRQYHRMLHAGATLLVVVAVGILLAAWRMPMDVTVARKGPPTSTRAAASPSSSQSPVNIAELQALAKRDLRPPLVDTPATVPTGGLNLQLVGTMHEPGHSIAMLRKADGTTALCAVGERVDDAGTTAIVKAIETDRVRLDVGGVLRELRVPTRPEGGTP